MGMMIRVAFNNQGWAGKCKDAANDKRLFKCHGQVIDVRFPGGSGFEVDKNGNCACGWCFEAALCTEYYWVSGKNFRHAQGNVFFLFPDEDNSLVLWGRSKVRDIRLVHRDADKHYRLYFEQFKPMPPQQWIRALRGEHILGKLWGMGTYRYLTEDQENYLEALIRSRTQSISSPIHGGTCETRGTDRKTTDC
jgi:hypothetical protein